ncbi:hypothetical protein [Oceanithermus sp.]
MRAADAPTLTFNTQGLPTVASRGPKPLTARFGLGVGAIDQLESLATAPRDPIPLTGPAFVAAAEALARARKEKGQVVIKSRDSRLDAAANGTFGLAEFVWNRWSPEVWRRALRYDELEDIGRLADELGVSYQAVHKQLHARGVLTVREALTGIGALLEEVA